MRRPYLTDLTDAEWECIEGLLPTPENDGRPRLHSLREILNAIFYVVRSGCAWRLLMVSSIAGIAVGLSGLGVTTYALPRDQAGLPEWPTRRISDSRGHLRGVVRELFVPVVLYSAGFVLFGVAIWHFGVLPRPAAISFGLHAPLVEGFFRAQLSWVSVVGALLFLFGGGVIAFSVFRRPSAGETEAGAESREHGFT
jgi:Putative transposase of IS4/5 family (DUF4096)